jgi:hypothetical protein
MYPFLYSCKLLKLNNIHSWTNQLVPYLVQLGGEIDPNREF